MNKFTIFFTMMLVVLSIGIVFAEPNGASSATAGSSSRANSTDPSSRAALAGNVTEITVLGETITQSWQGYFGNVSGAIRLGDASSNIMYNWSIASPSGEVFASISDSVSWASIACFNWTANGTDLETTYNINDSVDGVNETFSDSNVHDGFYVGGVEFVADGCMSTQIFNSSGVGSPGEFEEVLLTDGTNVVFASLLEQDTTGFDNKPHDFEMLVLEDGHNDDTSTTPYYFYVELE